MTAKKCILILTADAGFGHRSAALAVQSALQELTGQDCDIHLINPLEDKRTPFFLRDSQADYDQIVKEAPELYKLGYDASDNPLPSDVLYKI
jgi:1,2-diacylglycerol 3-beta-galactosyltransferase